MKKNDSLLDSYTLPSGTILRNRILMAPMTHSSSTAEGEVTDDEVHYYTEHARGVGAVITACAYVQPNGKGHLDAFGVDTDARIAGLKKIATGIKSEGSKAILQIFHAGRMSPSEFIGGTKPVSASSVKALRENAVTPKSLSHEEILEIIESFKQATRRAILAGFDGVEIHGANTYLIQQFFSPHSNRREDQWGGTLENRSKFPFAIIHAVQEAVTEHAEQPFIVGYRLSPEELEQPGITIADTFFLIDKLAEEHLDYIHVSLGNAFQGSIRDKKETTPVLLRIKEKIADRTPLIGVGKIETAEDANKVRDAGIPLLALGRALIYEPDWVQKYESGHADTIRTYLTPDSKEERHIPYGLWDKVLSVPGWFNFKEE
ncbi:NADH-dependent flavin oxidoreductase [Lacticigenium naphthae]|uniref:NADH-dependent flavin oxidoreductase n=1 Tax=Lacticigenium naphthae TaxID=515351 RepID=UPI000415B12C|nr:NADH-dependent flavin oxidoreductase [Lacticigenium naphthae]